MGTMAAPGNTVFKEDPVLSMYIPVTQAQGHRGHGFHKGGFACTSSLMRQQESENTCPLNRLRKEEGGSHVCSYEEKV